MHLRQIFPVESIKLSRDLSVGAHKGELTMKKLTLINLGSAVAIAATVMVGGMTAKAMEKPGRGNMLRPPQMQAQQMGTIVTTRTMDPMGHKIKNG